MRSDCRSYAIEAAQYGINCNVVILGVTRRDAWGKIAEQRGSERDEFRSSFAGRAVPAKEVIEAFDVGDTIKFLALPV